MNIKYNILSRYRSELMGIAILWVIFSHTSLVCNISAVNTIKNIGYGGVDIFLMVSGMGLYYSFTKNHNTLSFYKRRLTRILPTYIPVVIVYDGIKLAFHKIVLSTLILNCLTLPFWLGLKDYFDWYIPALLMLYLFSPFILQHFLQQPSECSKLKFIICCIILGFILSGLCILFQRNYLLIFTSRIPIFCIGILIGYYSKEDKTIQRAHKVSLALAFFIGSIMLYIFYTHYAAYAWQYGLWWWPFIFMTLPLCLMAAAGLNALENVSRCKFKLFKYCGELSLELYLFFTCINNLLGRILTDRHWDSINLISNLIIIALTFILASLWHKIIYILNGSHKGGKLHALYIFNCFKHR